MLDAYIPTGALTPDAERDLRSTLTELLIHHEGGDPTDPAVRSIAWVFLNRPETVYVAGMPSQEPRYRFVAAVPEGQYNAERRQNIVAAITEAVLDAEHGAHDRDPRRVWVSTPEIPDGTWGRAGRIVSLADIIGLPSATARPAAPTLPESSRSAVASRSPRRADDMAGATPSTVAAFRRAVEAGDTDGVLGTLAGDVAFDSPVMFRPFPRLLGTWKHLRYTGELHRPGEIGLIFTADVGRRTAQGIDFLRLDGDHRMKPHRHGPFPSPPSKRLPPRWPRHSSSASGVGPQVQTQWCQSLGS